ncbi:hypothetical protein [Streptomyces sp. NRRL F-2664]|uniref:hypothetical protein n=1 Tax=Streptomyces sp. NRRL F-2664 TaxID=1463842 RepID=UPI0004C81E1B|nr:hypothetical protein [Streptomyces sp. NRRL F-2664]
MGNSVAHPVLRTADPAEAHETARHLCRLLATRYEQVYVGAELRTVADVRRMAGLLPDALYDYAENRTDPATGATLYFGMDVRTAPDTELAGEMPLWFCQEELPEGVGEEDFVRAVGAGPASVRWEGCWPDEPEWGSYPSPACDGVQLVLNSEVCEWPGETAGVHTVYVHVTTFGDLGRAERLAAAVGGAVLGGPEQG